MSKWRIQKKDNDVLIDAAQNKKDADRNTFTCIKPRLFR